MRVEVRDRKAIVLGVLSFVTLVGATLDSLGWAPWVLLIAVTAILIVLFGQRLSWGLATAATVSAMLAAYAVWLRLAAQLPEDLGTKNRWAIVAVAALGLFALALNRRKMRLPSSTTVRHAALALGPIIVAFVALAITVSVTSGTRLYWAMTNDAVWNTMSARLLWADGGISTAHPNVSPLTAGLLAGSFAPGRIDLNPAMLLEHDVTRQAQLWLLLMLASCLLAAIIAHRRLERIAVVPRWIAVFLVACIPLSWFVAGFASQFGFYNSTIVVLLLFTSWIAWSSARSERLSALVVLSMSSIGLLATWAPLALISLAIALVVLCTANRTWWLTMKGWRGAGLAAAVAATLVYCALVTLPDLLRESTALAANGAIFAFGPLHFLVISALTSLATGIGAWVTRRWWEFIGTAIVVSVSGVALAYLLLQRSGAQSWWGYYPVKFSWLVAILLVVILAAATFAWLENARSGWQFAATMGGIVILLGGVVTFLPSTPESRSALPSIVAPQLIGVSSELPAQVLAFSDPREKNVVALYNETPGEDLFINGWLLQQAAVDGLDPIRNLAYTLDGTQVSALCEVAALWGEVAVHTRSEDLEAELAIECPHTEATVVVHR